MNRLLIIEDESFKARRISTFVASLGLPIEVRIERSVTSGLTALFSEDFAALLLDMSLSTFDVGAKEGGGRPQNFGGMGVLEHMRRRGKSVPVIVITQYPTFKRDGREVSLDVIGEELRARYPSSFRRMVYYNSREVAWEAELKAALLGLNLGA